MLVSLLLFMQQTNTDIMLSVRGAAPPKTIRVRTIVLDRSGKEFSFSYPRSFFIDSSFAIILVPDSSSCFILGDPMREVSCVRYELCAWDPNSL